MILDVNEIKPLKGKMNCYLWENEHTNLPLTLFYSIEIPLKPFDTGHEYVSQPTETEIIIEWIVFENESNGVQVKNWKKLSGKSFSLSYESENAEGSIYLGSEHCPLNSEIKFLSLNDKVFEVEINLNVEFNIDTKNLSENGLINIRTQIEFEGLNIYENQLSSFQNADDKMKLIENFVDKTVYDEKLVAHQNKGWKQLKPR